MFKDVLKAVGAIAGVPLLAFALLCGVAAVDVLVHGNSLPPTYEEFLGDFGVVFE